MRLAQESSPIAIVGAGLLGLTMALRLAQAGRQVDLYEADERVGGLARSVPSGDLTLDCFGHVVLLSERNTLTLLRELGLSHRLRVAKARTGFYTGGKVHGMSGVSEFLRFKPLEPFERLRLALTIAVASRVRRPKRLEKRLATRWFTRWSGRSVVDKVWKPVLESKAGGTSPAASAGMVRSLVERFGALRLFGIERGRVGVIDGGYAIVMHALLRKLAELGVQVYTGTPVRSVRNMVTGVLVTSRARGVQAYAQVVVTAAPKIAQAICPDLQPREKARMAAVSYQGLICATLLLRKPLSPYYRTTLADKMPFSEVVETTALTGTDAFGGCSLVHLPLYLSQDAPQWDMNATELARHFVAGLATMYPGFNHANIVDCKVSRVRLALPDSALNYSRDLMPPVSGSVSNVHFVSRAQIACGTLSVDDSIALAERHIGALLAVTRAARKPAVKRDHPGEPTVRTEGFGSNLKERPELENISPRSPRATVAQA